MAKIPENKPNAPVAVALVVEPEHCGYHVVPTRAEPKPGR
jgi:hypothetical protein